jgi:hypothetical protein
MCYPKPGPRCSAHAKTRYIRLLQKQQALINASDITWEQSRKLQAEVAIAELDYDSTPVGQAHLKLRIEQGKDYNGALAERLNNARALRTMQLQKIKAVDAGDINSHGNIDAGWSTDGFLSKDAHRKDWDSEKSQESFKKYMDFSEEFTQKISTEESMALYWYTDDGASAVNSLIRSQLTKSTGKWTYNNQTNSASEKYSKVMIENHMNTLDSIFYKHELKEPTVLYRGLGDNNLPKEIENASVDSPEFNEFLAERYPAGEEISIPEYMSTSADPAVAHGFAGSQSVVLEIKTKSAVPVGLVSTYNTSEREFLVNRDGRYTVKSVLKDVTYKNVSHESSPDNEKVTVIQLEEMEAFSLPDLPDFL